jgi:hypothetical protein
VVALVADVMAEVVALVAYYKVQRHLWWLDHHLL